MKQLVDDVLAERRHRDSRRRRLTAGVVALAGHTLLAALVALAPVFAARRQQDVRDYVRVTIVPAKILGDATAPPKPAARPKPRPSTPAPTTRTVEKKPERTSSEQAPSATPQRSAPSREAEDDGAEAEDTSPADDNRRRGGPDGSAFGTSAFGSSEASFDDPNFRYGYYVQQMLALIGGHWVRPRASHGTEMIVHFNISRRGVISEIEVVRESGNRAFDLAGFRAVALASPLPPLPQSYPSDSLGVNLVIR